MTIDIHFGEVSDERKNRVKWRLKRALLAAVLMRGTRWVYKKRYEELDEEFERLALDLLAGISVSVMIIRKDARKLREETEDFE